MFNKNKSIEDLIIENLAKGPLYTVDLLLKINTPVQRVTKQGFYKILKSLLTNEIVVIRKKIVSLSHVWILGMDNFVQNAKKSYSIETQGEDFLLLKDGEKVSYIFKSPEQTDMFWGHAFSVLVETTQEKNICLFNPHEWFLVARNEPELVLFRDLIQRNKNLFVLNGNKKPVDIYVKKYFNGSTSQYFTIEHSPFEKTNYYVNIFGDFIIEAWLDEKVSQKIDDWYSIHSTVSDEAIEELKRIVSEKGKNKFSISRNHKKAEKLRKIFKKYFLIK